MLNKDRLKKYLDDEDISQEKFAEMIGCTQQFVSFLLLGSKQPSIALLKIISNVTGITMDELVCG